MWHCFFTITFWNSVFPVILCYPDSLSLFTASLGVWWMVSQSATSGFSRLVCYVSPSTCQGCQILHFSKTLLKKKKSSIDSLIIEHFHVDKLRPVNANTWQPFEMKCVCLCLKIQCQLFAKLCQSFWELLQSVQVRLQSFGDRLPPTNCVIWFAFNCLYWKLSAKVWGCCTLNLWETR